MKQSYLLAITLALLLLDGTDSLAGENDDMHKLAQEEPELFLESCQDYTTLFGPNGSQRPYKAIYKVATFIIDHEHEKMAFYVDGKSDKYIVFYVPVEEPPWCYIYRINKALDRLWGTFGPDPEMKLKAFVLKSEECDEHECGVAIVIRQKDEKVLFVHNTDADLHCSQGIELAELDAFGSGQTSLLMRCNNGVGGADFEQVTALFHITDGVIREVFRVYTGFGFVEPSEDDKRLCTVRPAGWLKVTRPGSTPELQTFTPNMDTIGVEPGKIKGEIRNWRFNQQKLGFDLIGQPAPAVEPLEIKCEEWNQ